MVRRGIGRPKLGHYPTEAALVFRVLMEPHSIRVKLRDQPFDAFDLGWVSRRTQQLAVALNPFVYVYARLAHALLSRHSAAPTLSVNTTPHALQS
jgi:hypothetical protein